MTNSDRKPELEIVLIAAGLVNIQDLDTDIVVDLKYSQTDNFVKADVYDGMKRCYLQREPAEMLVRAHAILKKEHPGYRFLVWDGARPRRVQQVFWGLLDVPEEDKPGYLARPEAGSVHNFGAAIDLTIVDKNGNELDMGTPFDDFSEAAHINKNEYLLEKGLLQEHHIHNRNILLSVMEHAGFQSVEYEWWHFNAFPKDVARAKYGMIE